jgi:8-amino-7-oxononanoate synthase
MLDFTSVLYLGMQHTHAALQPWQQLTTGRPAALQSPVAARRIEKDMAGLLGCEAAVLGPSSLHLFWDLFDILAKEPIVILVDAGTYPIPRWGIERVVAKGIVARTFPKHSVGSLRSALRCSGGRRPVVVTDGLCPLTGRPAPLSDFADLVRRHGGLLVIDDTQGLGILGRRPAPLLPYGLDGAGTPAWHGLSGPDVIVVNSLAKAFGAPLAVIGGSRCMIDTFKELSQTRVHCSPPSMAALRAAEAALEINAADGPMRRDRLISLIRLFRAGLQAIGLSAQGGLFPVQTLQAVIGDAAITLHAKLLRNGVRTVLHRRASTTAALISFVLTARHSPALIAEALLTLRRTCFDPRPFSRAAVM